MRCLARTAGSGIRPDAGRNAAYFLAGSTCSDGETISPVFFMAAKALSTALAVKTREFGDLAGVERFAGLAHGFENDVLVFHFVLLVLKRMRGAFAPSFFFIFPDFPRREPIDIVFYNRRFRY